MCRERRVGVTVEEGGVRLHSRGRRTRCHTGQVRLGLQSRGRRSWVSQWSEELWEVTVQRGVGCHTDACGE